MSQRIIPDRDGIEVFVNERSRIAIKQSGGFHEDDGLLELHPDDVPQFIEFLHDAVREAREHAATKAQETAHA